MLRWLDIPPFWLIGALGLTWGFDGLVPGLGAGLGWLRTLGDLMVLAGLVSMALGALELMRHHTSFIPRHRPDAFVRQGIYRLTRNPIYLGDALVLTGAVLHWDVLPALILVPGFMALIQNRFIKGEEAGLVAAFGDEAKAWFGRVRRWL